MIEQVGQKIRNIRELQNLSQEYVATQLEISTRAYSKIETEETQLTINRLNQLSLIFKLTPQEILGFDSSQIFNHCDQRENNGTFGTTNYYNESLITHLKEEVVYLRAQIENILNKT